MWRGWTRLTISFFGALAAFLSACRTLSRHPVLLLLLLRGRHCDASDDTPQLATAFGDESARRTLLLHNGLAEQPAELDYHDKLVRFDARFEHSLVGWPGKVGERFFVAFYTTCASSSVPYPLMPRPQTVADFSGDQPVVNV